MMGREDSLIEAHKWILGGCGGVEIKCEEEFVAKRCWSDSEEVVGRWRRRRGGEQHEKGVGEVEVEGKVEIEVVEV